MEDHSIAPGSVADSAVSIGVELEPAQCRIIGGHLEMVLSARSRLNLISESTARDALRLHVADSLAAVNTLAGSRKIVDIGSGAGYPGIPLAAATGAHVALVESRGKRARFLQEVLDRLEPSGLRGDVVNERAESARAIDASAPADAVVVRAVASLPTIVELAAPFLTEGGLLVAFKGSCDESELERGDRAASMVGLSDRRVEEFLLPGGGERRQLVTYRAVGEPTIELPRREGRATKSPLS